MSLTAPERETIITLNDEDATAHIWTAQRPWITKLKKNPAATLLDEGTHDGSVWAEFEVDAKLLTIRNKRQTGRPMSNETKAKLRAGRQSPATVENHA